MVRECSRLSGPKILFPSGRDYLGSEVGKASRIWRLRHRHSRTRDATSRPDSSVWPCYFRRDLLRGPFYLTLTDLHHSNIFVDDDWNITYFVDLEWACSCPAEMIHPPYWLSNQAIDMITLDKYESLHTEFMEALAEEEAKTSMTLQLHPILQQGWERRTFWCSLALGSPTALFMIFYDYIQPGFPKDRKDNTAFWSVTMPYWTFNTFSFIKQRAKDKEQYDKSLREAFEH